jgi:hypothetical protein
MLPRRNFPHWQPRPLSHVAYGLAAYLCVGRNFSDLGTMLFFGLVEEIPEIIKVAKTFLPWLAKLALVGKIIQLTGVGEMDENKALEQLQRAADNQKKVRQKVRDELNKRVIKVKDALDCVEKSVFDPKNILKLGKGILATIVGKGATGSFVDIIYAEIEACMKSKMLKQENKRTRGKFVRTRGKEPQFSEIEVIRRGGKMHPFA